MSKKRLGDRIVTKVSERTSIGWEDTVLMGLLMPGASLLLGLLKDEKKYEAEAIDRRSGARATGYGCTEEDAEFMAIDKLTSTDEFRNA